MGLDTTPRHRVNPIVTLPLAVTIAVAIFVIGNPFGSLSRLKADEKDLFQPGSVWKGEIHQDGDVFKASCTIRERNRERLKGDLEFTTPRGSRGELTLEGKIVDGSTVAWITDKKAGDVTYPGLYLGKLTGREFTGTWQVPSANQYDRFWFSSSLHNNGFRDLAATFS